MRNPILKKLQEGVKSGVFPGCVLLVAYQGKICFHEAVGSARLVPRRVPMHRHTLFDLASLTKPFATASVFAHLISQRRFSLHDPVSRFIPAFKKGDKRKVTLTHLLTHRSGLPDWRPYYEAIRKREAQEPGFMGSDAAKQAVYRMAQDEPLVAPVGAQNCYSDIGFILLGEILEKVSGWPLDRLCAELIFAPLKGRLFFQRWGHEKKGLFAATEDVAWRGGVVCGKVHDENGYVMGGVAGHAGLFGSARAVLRMVQGWQEALHGGGAIDRKTASLFVTRDHEKNVISSFGLGWDTPSPVGSSAGSFFSPSSFGHLGFTGTSVWVDPTQNLVVILLTNRIHPSRDNHRIRQFRPELHDLVFRERVQG